MRNDFDENVDNSWHTHISKQSNGNWIYQKTEKTFRKTEEEKKNNNSGGKEIEWKKLWENWKQSQSL